MKIWIDISNSPHAHFFRALIHRLEKNDFEVVVTTREFDWLHDILDNLGINYTSIGKHGGREINNKLIKSAERIKKLTEFILKEKPSLTISKCSVEAARVCFGLNIPSILIVDNEYAESVNKLTIPFADTVIIPKATPKKIIEKFGAKKILQFYGVCEYAHYIDFKLSKKVLSELSISKNRPLIISRSEPILASYLYKKSGLKKVLQELLDCYPGLNIIFLPRNKIDKKEFESLDIIIPSKAIDTLSLYKFTDLMIGAGGSMNREACLACVPMISLYPEKILAVDKFLINKGLMQHTLNIKEALEWSSEFINNGKLWKNKFKKEIENFENPHDLIVKEIEKFCE